MSLPQQQYVTMQAPQSFVMPSPQQQVAAASGLYAAQGMPLVFQHTMAQQEDMTLQHHDYLQQQAMYASMNVFHGQAAPSAYAPSPIYRHGHPYM
jgi:hypothetical protein